MQSKKCTEANNDIHLSLLQIRLTPVGIVLPSPTTLLFNMPISGIVPGVSRMPVSGDYDEDNHNTL